MYVILPKTVLCNLLRSVVCGKSVVKHSRFLSVSLQLRTSPLLWAFFVQVCKLSLTSFFQITVYKIDDKNNLELDLAILSALLKGNPESITIE